MGYPLEAPMTYQSRSDFEGSQTGYPASFSLEAINHPAIMLLTDLRAILRDILVTEKRMNSKLWKIHDLLSKSEDDDVSSRED